MSPLHRPIRFAKKSSIEIVRLLLEKGADVNPKDCKGRTPLHQAVKKIINLQ